MRLVRSGAFCSIGASQGRPESVAIIEQEPNSPGLDSLSGLIERVTFFNEENRWEFVKIKAKGHRDLVTVVGSLPEVNAGEWVTAQGRWVQDKEYGLQLRADVLKSTPPTTLEGPQAGRRHRPAHSPGLRRPKQHNSHPVFGAAPEVERIERPCLRTLFDVASQLISFQAGGTWPRESFAL